MWLLENLILSMRLKGKIDFIDENIMTDEMNAIVSFFTCPKSIIVERSIIEKIQD